MWFLLTVSITLCYCTESEWWSVNWQVRVHVTELGRLHWTKQEQLEWLPMLASPVHHHHAVLLLHMYKLTQSQMVATMEYIHHLMVIYARVIRITTDTCYEVCLLRALCLLVISDFLSDFKILCMKFLIILNSLTFFSILLSVFAN